MKSIKAGKFQAPVNIALDVLQGTKDEKLCGGFKCNFCMSNLEDSGCKTKIPADILLSMPEFFSRWGVQSLCIAGHNSDPCLYNHNTMIDFLRLCHKFNVEVGFVSNGYPYSDKLLHEVTRTCNWSGWSINAGSERVHAGLTGVEGAFDKIINNIRTASKYVKDNRLKHDLGYKFLITDENHKEILTAVKLASEIGVRHFQIRPCELPEDRLSKIDIDLVEHQIKESLKYTQIGEFEVFGIREKFNPNFTKMPPKRCIASPLGSTWKADGDIVICPDRRWSAHRPNMIMGNFIKEGLQEIQRKWGGIEHIQMIQEANKNLGECIRCTSYCWHDVYEQCVEQDSLDITLI
jgi:MoaA/NifB/PqqE/SkfB family radical SAM enzyme